MTSLYGVQKKDIPTCSAVLARAFAEYPMYSYVLGSKHTLENVEAATRFYLTYAFRYANLYAVSPNIEGVIGFVDYKDYKISPFRFFRCGGLALARLGSDVGRRFSEYDRFTTNVHKEIIETPHQYIMVVGVDPDKQGQGLASRLLRPVLQLADARDQSSYLETHVRTNVDIYSRYGFELVGEQTLPDSGIVMYSMVRTPNTDSGTNR